MTKEVSLILGFSMSSIMGLYGQSFAGPDTVSVQSGKLTLKGLVWRPVGNGRFPAIVFCHGSYGGLDTVHDPLREASLLGPVFASKGYVILVPFRRGVGLSRQQGTNSTVLMDNAFKEGGQEARNTVQLQHLQTDQLQDMIAGISFLLKEKYVDTNRIAILGHSFGGSLALLVAERALNLKGVVVFSPGGYSWDRSSQLRAALITAVEKTSLPIMIIHAENDYSLNPGRSLDSVMNRLHKTHVLKIYPKFGSSVNDGHNLIFGNIEAWKTDVFAFLDQIFKFPGD